MGKPPESPGGRTSRAGTVGDAPMQSRRCRPLGSMVSRAPPAARRTRNLHDPIPGPQLGMAAGGKPHFAFPQASRRPLGARASWCAVQRHTLSAGVIPARQVSFQPVALGTVVEATKRLKHSEKRVRRDSASMQAVTRSERRAGPENSECGSRFRQDREKAAATRGSERHEHPRGSAGVVATACMYKGGCATREAPVGGRKRYGPTAAS